MRSLGLLLMVGGALWYLIELFSPGRLPDVGSPVFISLFAIGLGLVLFYLGELERQRRRWKGLTGNRR